MFQIDAAKSNWKATGFFNFVHTNKDGSHTKIGSFPVKDDKDCEMKLREWAEKDPANLVKLLSLLTMTYKAAGSTSTFDYADTAPVEKTADPKAAIGYINIQMKSKSGVMTDLEPIILRANMPDQVAVNNALKADPSVLDKMKAKFVIDYRSSIPVQKEEFALG